MIQTRDKSDLFAEWRTRDASRSARFKYAKHEPVFGGDGQGVAGTARIVHNILLKLQACRDGAVSTDGAAGAMTCMRQDGSKALR